MKYYYEIAPLKIIRTDSEVLTYFSNESLKIGTIVEIPVGKRKMVGVVWRKTGQPEFETREILRAFSKPLPKHLLKLAKWMSEFYATPLSQVLSGILPSGIFKNRRKLKPEKHFSENELSNNSDFSYTKQQSVAIQKLDKIKNGTVLLHGITGSGKTEIYINQAKKCIQNNQSVIILVPEIALTSQIVQNFSQHFSDVKIIHSKQTESQKAQIWKNILNNDESQIIIGARSAIFAPVRNLGLIIIDECHEPSFRQEQTPKYSAIRLANFMAKNPEIKTILGSATPSIEDYFLAKISKENGGAEIIELTELANKNAKPPTVEIIDLSKKRTEWHFVFSKKLIEIMNQTLSENRQVLIYHNRRGSASITACKNCGWQALCENCFLPMTLHHDKHTLSCHICGKNQKIPSSCPICGEAEIIHKGIGTKIIEEEARRIFPNKKIMRFDADSDKDETVEKLYSEIRNGKIDILIGTQILAKGLDLPKLKTVAIIQADAGLALPDFTSSERNFQLISQVVGRVGRHDSDTNVVVQTYQPEAKSVKFGIDQNYLAFYEQEIENRQKQNYPPFVFLLKLTCVYKTEKSAISNSKKMAEKIRKEFSGKVQIFGPTPAFYERIGDTYRWQIVIKSKKRGELLKIAKEFQTLPHWRVDLDSGLI